MSFRHWTSVTLAASFTVYVAGCGYGDRQSGGTSPAEGRSNEIVVETPAVAVGSPASGDVTDASAVETTDQSHDEQPLEIEGIGSFKTLFSAIEVAGLKQTLADGAPFTVFAPTDAAFSKLPEGNLEDLLKPEDKEKLASILTYHVVAGRVAAEQVTRLESAETVNGKHLPIVVADGGVKVGEANVLKTDIECEVGLIHAIDRVPIL